MSDDKPKLSPEAERLLDARRAAVEELRLVDGQTRSIHDAFVVRLANARLFEQSVTMRVLQDENVSAAEYRAAADLVADARAAVPAPLPEVKVEIVSKTTATCPQCKCVFDTRDHKPKPPVEPKPLETTIPAKELTSDVPKPVVTDPKQAPSPEQPRYASVHDHPGAPLKKLQPSITPSMFSVSPMSAPDWSAAHPLPTPPPECFK